MPAPPPPPPPPPPPLTGETSSSKPVPQPLPLSVSPSNSSTTVSESTHDDTASLDSTRTASTHSLPSPKQATEPQFQAVTTQMPFLEVTPSSPAPVPTSPRSPSSPSFQPPPANLSKSVRVKLKEIEDQLENDPSLSEEERQSKIKSEKIKIALEKLKKANIQKLIVRVFTDDGSSKTVFLDETMSCRGVTSMMIEKNHLEYKPMLAILEQVPDLYMERIVEDHENLVNDVLLNWKRETTSRILFSERKEKYGIFKNPQLVASSSTVRREVQGGADKGILLRHRKPNSRGRWRPLDEGEGKKSWKRFYFILRASGLYFSPKGKSKSSKDLVCLVGFEHNHVYHGVSWKKKYKAPTDHCFAIKHPQLQQKSKYIKYLCAEDYRSCQRWIAGIRLAKYGRQLLLNYNQTQQELREYKVRHISETSSITNGMPDTVSLSSMHSTVSSHSSSSGSLHDSRSSGRSSLSIYQPTQVLPLQANAPIRRGTVGNMFANAWKKGLETDGKGSNATNSNGNFIQSPTSNENTELHRPAIVTPTKSKRPSQTLNEFEVQRALQELDMELDMSNDKELTKPSRRTTPNFEHLIDESNTQYHLVNPEPFRKPPSPLTSSGVTTNEGNISPSSPLTPTPKRNSLGSPSRHVPPPPPVRSPTTRLSRLSGTEDQFTFGNLGARQEPPKRVQFRDSYDEIPRGPSITIPRALRYPPLPQTLRVLRTGGQTSSRA
ncbi:putative ras-associated and pleckstrin-likey domains-containing protein 1 isoform X5 [Apostichopus japonicus]|uniref:Putative ras-associated and pleckstrin-likey domains-containing protein 1 isoform X5 n=1 Tax=Stichopus japonicus TaxID=307972 RepID=A0A2G8JZC2_STIJA|nr:putative ras-associated and pleckstrin-likey domains-containing protein 1 isoform X5 [Apostichopus japonicus]